MATPAVLIPTQALSAPLTMTSTEIADVTGKNHRDVVRDLRKLEDQGVVMLRSFAHLEEIKTLDGRPTGTRTIYRLPKRETLILTSGYSAVQRAAVIDRLFALEAQAAAPAPVRTYQVQVQVAMTAEQYIAHLEGQLGLAPAPAQDPAPAGKAPRRIIEAADRARIVALYNAGQGLSAIAKATGWSRRAVGRILERATAAAEVSA